MMSGIKKYRHTGVISKLIKSDHLAEILIAVIIIGC